MYKLVCTNTCKKRVHNVYSCRLAPNETTTRNINELHQQYIQIRIYYFIIHSQYIARALSVSLRVCVFVTTRRRRDKPRTCETYIARLQHHRNTQRRRWRRRRSFLRSQRYYACLPFYTNCVYTICALCVVLCVKVCVYGLDDDQRPSRHHITKHGTGTGSMCRLLQIAKFSSTMVKWLNSQLITNIVLKEVI